MIQFENKTFLVTGGASGIVFLTAKCFAQEGASVAIVDFDQKGLDKALSELKQVTDRVIGFPVDVRDYAMVEKAAQKTVSEFGSIDILVACAGGAETRIIQGGAFYELPIEVVDWGIDVNLKGALYFDHVAMKQMVKQKSGVIINLGSMTGVDGAYDALAYSASKSALMNGVVKSLALAGAEFGIRACCVAPGPVLTRPSIAEAKSLLGGPIQTQEIVDMILYLASDKAASMTGSTVLLDRGTTIMHSARANRT